MARRRSIYPFIYFMMPAFVVLAVYASVSDKINRKPDCTFNCNSAFNQFSIDSKTKLKKTLDLIDYYRKKYTSEFSLYDQENEIPLFRKPNAVDLAFLQEKLNAIHKAYYDEADFTKLALNDNSNADSNQNNTNSSSDQSSLILANSNELSPSQRFEYSRGINQYVFSDTYNQNALTQLSQSNLGDNTIANNSSTNSNYPNFTSPNPLAFTKANNNVVNNSPLFVLATNTQNPIDVDPNEPINQVPLSPSQYFMVIGLGVLLLLKSNKLNSKPFHLST